MVRQHLCWLCTELLRSWQDYWALNLWNVWCCCWLWELGSCYSASKAGADLRAFALCSECALSSLDALLMGKRTKCIESQTVVFFFFLSDDRLQCQLHTATKALATSGGKKTKNTQCRIIRVLAMVSILQSNHEGLRSARHLNSGHGKKGFSVYQLKRTKFTMSKKNTPSQPGL